MRHVLGVLGVVAAGVLLAVSAAMNWRFGFSLGKTELDGQIYGAASAAADCFKALVPFFFFAALRNRMWSQAAASAMLWIVVTSYSLTSALGHAMLNRQDTAGQRSVEAAQYQDLRTELKRVEDQLSWIPQHRPAMAVQSELDGIRSHRVFGWTRSCTEVTGKANTDFCQRYHALSSELASAQKAETLGQQAAAIKSQLGKTQGGSVMAEADPQAAVLAKLASALGLTVKIEDMQTALAVFVALLLEVGSGFGMYVAFSTWRLYDRAAPSVPAMKPAVQQATVQVAAPVAVQAQKPAQPKTFGIANDNKSAPVATTPRLVAPETDVQRYKNERTVDTDGSSLTATSLYEDYCAWCEEQEKEPLALPTFGREFGELERVTKAKIAGRIRYIGLALKSGQQAEEDKKLPAARSEAA